MEGQHLNERLEEVVNLIPRLSWEIMVEAQKDELMEKVVLPRYKAITSDGTKLGATTWAAILGTTPQAIKDRIYRLRQDPKRSRVGQVRQDDIARARRVASSPDTRAAFIESLPIETKVEVAKALAATPASPPISKEREQTTRAVMAPLRRSVNDAVAKLGTVTLIDRATAEINEAVARDGFTPDALRQIEASYEALGAAIDFAKSMAGEVT